MYFPKTEIRISVIVLLVAAVFISCENTESDKNGGGTAADSLQVFFVNHNQLPERSIHTFSPDAEPEYQLNFEEDRVYKQINYHFAVDEQGRIYEWGNKNIRVYREDGTLLTRLGREGKGPGEFLSFSVVPPRIKSNRLYAFDGTLLRFNVFSLDSMEPINEIIIRPDTWRGIENLDDYQPITRSVPQHYSILNDSTILLGFRKPFTVEKKGIILNIGMGNPNPEREHYIRYYLMNTEGEITSDRVLQQKDLNFYPGTGKRSFGDIPPPLPSTRHAMTAVSPDGQIFAAWTEHFLVDVYSPEGDYLHSFYYPVEKREVDRDEIIDNYYDNPSREQLRMLRDRDYPDTWPATHNMLTDDKGRLWVATITDNNEHYRWWVLSPEGELLAQFEWPGNPLTRHRDELGIRHIKNGYLYEYEESFDPDENIIEKTITRYRILWNEN